MDIAELETFLVVAEERNFSRAAEKLYRTQPAVSIVIRKLEEWVGQPLFERGARAVKLTDAGELLVEYAERILNLREETRKGMEELQHLERGRLSLGVNESWIHVLLPVLAEYRRLHPVVQITVHRTFSRDIPRAVLSYRIDMGVVSYLPEEKNLEAVDIFQDKLTFIVAPNHRLASRNTVDISALAHETFAAHVVESTYRSRVIRLFEDHRVPLNMTVQLPTIESIKRFVQMEMAVAIVPRTCVQWELERGWLAEVKIKQLNMNRQLYLVHRRGAKLSHSALEFLRLLRAGWGSRTSGKKPRKRRTKQ